MRNCEERGTKELTLYFLDPEVGPFSSGCDDRSVDHVGGQ